jgi:hypothetical protein
MIQPFLSCTGADACCSAGKRGRASWKVSGLKLVGEYGVMVASCSAMLTRRAGIGKPAIPCHKDREI